MNYILPSCCCQMEEKKGIGMSQVDGDPLAAVTSFPICALGCVSPKRREELKNKKRVFAHGGAEERAFRQSAS